MPTYSYRCADCGHAFDIQQAFTDDSLTVCPECAGTLRKVFGNVGVTFSGSGFYRTDSRESAKSKDAASSTGAEKKAKDAGGSPQTAPAAASPSSGSSSTSPKSGTAAAS